MGGGGGGGDSNLLGALRIICSTHSTSNTDLHNICMKCGFARQYLTVSCIVLSMQVEEKRKKIVCNYACNHVFHKCLIIVFNA